MQEPNTKKVVREQAMQELTEHIIQYAKKEGMTISIIRDCVDRVEMHMRDNAILEKADPEWAEKFIDEYMANSEADKS